MTQRAVTAACGGGRAALPACVIYAAGQSLGLGLGKIAAVLLSAAAHVRFSEHERGATNLSRTGAARLAAGSAGVGGRAAAGPRPRRDGTRAIGPRGEAPETRASLSPRSPMRWQPTPARPPPAGL